MVESTLFESRPDGERIGRRKKPATLAMSAVVHVLLCGVLILIPLMQTQAVPPVALPPPPVQLTSPTRFVKLAAVRPAGGGSSRPAPAPSVAALPEPMIDPTAIPDKIAYIADAIYIGSDASFRGGPNGSSIGVGPGGPGVLGGTGTGDAPSFAPPPPPPAPPVPPAPKILVREPIRVSGGLKTLFSWTGWSRSTPPLPGLQELKGQLSLKHESPQPARSKICASSRGIHSFTKPYRML